MHTTHLTTLTLLLACLSNAIPAPSDASNSLLPRDLTWTNQPSTEPKCLNTAQGSPDTAAYSNADIEAAIQAAVSAIQNNKLVSTGTTKKRAKYPHQNTPGSGKSAEDKWTDYDLPGCAQSSSDAETKNGFVEFPILRDHKVYTGGTQEQGPDRVLFQFITDGDESKTYDTPGFPRLRGNFKSAAYCGLANHVVRDDKFLGTFAPCDNSKGQTVTCPDGGCTGSVG